MVFKNIFLSPENWRIINTILLSAYFIFTIIIALSIITPLNIDWWRLLLHITICRRGAGIILGGEGELYSKVYVLYKAYIIYLSTAY